MYFIRNRYLPYQTTKQYEIDYGINLKVKIHFINITRHIIIIINLYYF